MTTDKRCAGDIPCYLNDNGECVATYALAGNSIVADGNYTDENGNVDGVLYNIFRKLLVETGRDKQPNDQLSLF